jgi:hypothetical protein
VSLFALVLAFALPTGVVEAVRIEQAGLRPAVTVVTRGGSGAVSVRREGREVILTVGASLPIGLQMPRTVPPLEGLSAAPEGEGTALRLTVAEYVPYQILRTETAVSVVLGPVAPTSDEPLGEKRPAQELYPLIFAVPADPAMPDELGYTPPSEGVARRDEAEGFQVGFLRLRPAVMLNYVDAQTSLFDTPQPSRQRYFEIDPRLGLGMGLGIGTELAFFGGRLEIRYEPRFRPGVSLAALRRPSHSLTVNATVPVGSAVTLRAGHQYVSGFLETTVVDPGREYFFDLGPFVRNRTEAGARVETGSRFDLDVEAARETLDIEDSAAFFDHRVDRLSLELGYALRADLRTMLDYAVERVPRPDRRPQAESSASRLTLGLAGELLPLVKGSAHAGVEDRRSPGAAPGGEHFRGFVADLSLDKEFTPSSRFTLAGRRSLQLSGFENNAFYISHGVEASQTMGLPFFVVFRGAVAQQWNRYRTIASGLAEPRRDEIFGWTVGVGRPFTRWAFLRVDYRHERRRSNLAAFRVTSHALVLQVGIGYVGNAQPDAAR